MGGTDSPVVFLLTQATIVLITCSIVLTGLKDLYDDKEVPADTPDQPRVVKVPLLESEDASKLRKFVREQFVRGLVLFYAIFAILVCLIEIRSPGEGALFTLSVGAFGGNYDFVVKLKSILITFTIVHVFIVVVVAGLVRCMVEVRDYEAQQRWSKSKRV